MGFIEDAESLRAKAHVSNVPKPVLAGVVALAVVVALLAAGAVVSTAGSLGGAAFELTRSDGAGAGADAVADAAGSAADGADGEAEGEQASSEAATVFVHVAGAVAAPGVYELPAGSRLQAAVDAAGGFAADAATDAVNLAQEATDGQQVVVPTQEEAASAAGAGSAGGTGAPEGASGAAAGGVVNINTATEAQLDTLPGVGPSTAAKIVADREANGPFERPEDLKRVSGIGDKKYEQLAAFVAV